MTILESLTRSANSFVVLAAIWHVLLALVLATRWILPLALTQRLVAVLLTLPLFSVSAVAWWSRNVFNAVVCVLLGAALLYTALRLPSQPLARAPRWARALGALGLAYAVGYPHFVAVAVGWHYLLLAPLGVVPCPTLGLLVAGTLLAGGFGSRAWSWSVALAALSYASFGVLWLGVWLDLGLLVLAAALCMQAWRAQRAVPIHPSAQAVGERRAFAHQEQRARPAA